MSDTGLWKVRKDDIASIPEEVWEKVTSRVRPFPKKVIVISTPTHSTMLNMETKEDE